MNSTRPIWHLTANVGAHRPSAQYDDAGQRMLRLRDIGKFTAELTQLNQLNTPDQQMLDEVILGLSQDQKVLPPKYFYDVEGSRLFDEICELDEYYVTRTELAIMEEFAPEIGGALGPRCFVVEFGSGAGIKTRLLLDNLISPAGYAPVDIAVNQLKETSDKLSADYPDLSIIPIQGDFTRPIEFPDIGMSARRRVVYFSGSTIGNRTHSEIEELLRQIAILIGPDGALLIGVDLIKDESVLNAAYNDSKGVTAKFNLNVLNHINDRLGADFNVSNFRHHAFYHRLGARIEMHLISECNQKVLIKDHEINFKEHETILTEYSCKFTPESFSTIAATAGLGQRNVWIDKNRLFSVQLFVRESVIPG